MKTLVLASTASDMGARLIQS